ncbi:cell envelope-related transcriptional attenuator [Segniliparus rotundus DSM 44985]|uniref:Cell envelope-related transcriptional attenuator n=1 Tax=Segniliparus rotundus (strain ATCC BAA-972 / CDC 1076 / CIP 108378 / DSM 44985 / JCM 13578) TaxID=640132 RepID=D6ZA63_SEGRD|nr:LCP family protein [Segniliparus rotundus]ADG96605.1 cell envelope-related transcriptional attenuator [Segniliparus rotundus DSM 44985]
MRIPDLSDETTRRRLAAKAARANRIRIPERAAAAERSSSSILRPLSGKAELPPVPSKPARARWEAASRLVARAAVVLLAVSSLAATGAFWGVSRGALEGKGVLALLLNDPNIKDPGQQQGDENFLLIGADTREGDNGKLGAGDVNDVEGSRSDTIILVNIPASRARVVAVSFPRDLQVDRPACAKWNSTTKQYSKEIQPAETHSKINSAYMYGGPRCLVQVVQKLSGLKVNHFIGEDFEGFSKMVDAVGGVQVCSTKPLYDDELGTVLAKSGSQTLDGAQALQYVRARQIEAEGTGDYGRIKRQQRFISSLLRSMLSQKILANPTKLNGLLEAFTDRAVMDGVKVDDLLKLAQSMQSIQTNKVTFITIPTTGTSEDGMNNEVPNDDGVRAIFDAIIYDKPLPGEGGSNTSSASVVTPWTVETTGKPATKTTTSSTPQPGPPPETQPAEGVKAVSVKGFTVQVVAPTSTILYKVAMALSKQGFKVDMTSSGVAHSDTVATIARFSPESRDAAATVASAIPGAIIELGSTPDADVELVVGSGGDVPTVVEPAAPGAGIVANEVKAVDGVVRLPENLTVTNGADTTC